jgi:hypothetical protein
MCPQAEVQRIGSVSSNKETMRAGFSPSEDSREEKWFEIGSHKVVGPFVWDNSSKDELCYLLSFYNFVDVFGLLKILQMFLYFGYFLMFLFLDFLMFVFEFYNFFGFSNVFEFLGCLHCVWIFDDFQMFLDFWIFPLSLDF